MLHHFSSYLKGRWEEWTQVISRTLGNRMKLKKRGVENKQVGRERRGEEKEGHRRLDEDHIGEETDEVDTLAQQYRVSPTDFWECRVKSDIKSHVTNCIQLHSLLPPPTHNKCISYDAYLQFIWHISSSITEYRHSTSSLNFINYRDSFPQSENVFPHLYNFIYSREHKIRYFEEQRSPKNIEPH